MPPHSSTLGNEQYTREKMRRKYKPNLIYYIFLLALLVAGCGGPIASDEHIEISSELSKPITHYHTAFISRNGRAGYDIDYAFSLWLLKQNINEVYQRDEADIEIIYENEKGWALPRFGRHFDIISEGFTKINVKLIDINDAHVIGEARYKRPLFNQDMPYVVDRILDKLTKQPIGLTDFSEWEKRKFPNSRLIIEVPINLRNYHDKGVPDDFLTIWMHQMPSKNGALNSQLFIQFKKFDPEKAKAEKIRILNSLKAQQNPEYHDRFSWELSYQPVFTSKSEFAVNGPVTIYLRDYKTKNGDIIRAQANLNNSLRPEGSKVDENAIKRMFESLVTY